MQILRLGRLLLGLFVQLVLAGLLGSSFPLTHATSAHAAESSPLVGWWIAVDRWWPTIWESAGIPPMEELLIVDADGRAENRLMQFYAPAAESCMASGNCSDAPAERTD